jgi:predicted PurR-regulated permease PerM
MSLPVSWPRWTLFLAPLALFLFISGSLLIAMLCGVIFAIALEPACDRVGRRLGRFHKGAPLLMVATSLSLVALPIVACVAFGSGDIKTLSGSLGELQKASVLRGMSAETTKMGNQLGVPVKAGAMLSGMQHAVNVVSEWLTELSRSSVRGTADALLSIFVFLLVFYGWLSERVRLQSIVMRVLPLQPAQSLRLLRIVRDSAVDAVLGACLVGLVQATVLLASLLILQVPGAWLLAVVAFFLSFVPILGTVPVSGFAVVYLILQHEPAKAVAMIACAGIVGLSDNVLRLVIRPRGTTPALINFIAILGGLEIIGVAGLFIGPVIAGMATWGVREILRQQSPRPAKRPGTLEPPPPPTPLRPESFRGAVRSPLRTPRMWRG